MIRWVSLWLSAVMLAGCASGQLPWGATRQLQELQADLAQIAKAAESPLPSGYVIKVHVQGKQVFSRHVDLASAEMGQSIHDETVFELASLSKIFTALAVMQLHEQGRLAMDQPLGRYLSDLPETWSGLTTHQLLSHQSGLPDLLNLWPRKRLDGLDFGAVLAHFRNSPALLFSPGTQAAYSNTNYMLLAHLVSQVSGLDFGEYLQRHVFEPAGMTSSSVLDAWPHWVGQLALPYALEDKVHGIDYELMGAIGQKGSMRDLEHFMQALWQHKLVQAQTLDLMMKPHAEFSDGKRYGYGWFIGRLGGWAGLSGSLPAHAVGHTGRLGAFRTALYFNRERRFQLIMLSNGGPRTEKLLTLFLQTTRDRLE
jgi:CubicO group peptidase (beta-lactamase class C family)